MDPTTPNRFSGVIQNGLERFEIICVASNAVFYSFTVPEIECLGAEVATQRVIRRLASLSRATRVSSSENDDFR